MPLYEYGCDDCRFCFEARQSMSEDALTECPECGGHVRRFLFPPTVFDATPRTIGGVADRNSDKGGRYWLDAKRAEENAAFKRPEQVERPWWRKEDKPNLKLADLTPKQKENYIVTGKANP